MFCRLHLSAQPASFGDFFTAPFLGPSDWIRTSGLLNPMVASKFLGRKFNKNTANSALFHTFSSVFLPNFTDFVFLVITNSAQAGKLQNCEKCYVEAPKSTSLGTQFWA